jgi:UDP-N-acetylmuramate dehydrogenase
MRDVNCLILGVILKIKLNKTDLIHENIHSFLYKRRLQPKGNSCGCVFKNPPLGPSAGLLIDKANLKGVRWGNARVSTEHANFILQEGVSSYDVYRLIAFVKEKVFEKFGILLEEEVVYIGDFYDSDG